MNHATANPPTSIRSLSAVLVSRFLLDLQEADQVVLRVNVDDPLYSSRANDIPSFISSLGARINSPVLSAAQEDDLESHVGASGSRTAGSDMPEEGGLRVVDCEDAASQSSAA